MSTSSRFSLNGDGKPAEKAPLALRERRAIVALNARYDALNRLWEQVEANLKRFPIPVDVFFAYRSMSVFPCEEGLDIQDNLGFVRSRGDGEFAIAKP